MTTQATMAAAGTDRLTVFEAMQPDLDHVTARVEEVAKLDYPLAAGIIGEIVKAGGKRLRPLLLLLSARSYGYGEAFDRLVTAGAGVELLHIASLVHDDTVDHAQLRRGKPTLNSVLSTGATILMGDFLFAQSAMLAAATGNVSVVTVFASTLGHLCNGQLLEMFDGHRLDQPVESYERRIFGKTASFYAGSAEMGAILGGAPASHLEELRAFGGDIGLGFQVLDDVLDLSQETATIGKPAGNDLRQGTVTLPVLLYAQRIERGGSDWRLIDDIISGDVTDDATIDGLTADIRASGAIDDATAMADGYIDRAKERLAVVPDLETRDMLSELADFFGNRTS